MTNSATSEAWKLGLVAAAKKEHTEQHSSRIPPLPRGPSSAGAFAAAARYGHRGPSRAPSNPPRSSEIQDFRPRWQLPTRQIGSWSPDVLNFRSRQGARAGGREERHLTHRFRQPKSRLGYPPFPAPTTVPDSAPSEIQDLRHQRQSQGRLLAAFAHDVLSFRNGWERDGGETADCRSSRRARLRAAAAIHCTPISSPPPRPRPSETQDTRSRGCPSGVEIVTSARRVLNFRI